MVVRVLKFLTVKFKYWRHLYSTHTLLFSCHCYLSGSVCFPALFFEPPGCFRSPSVTLFRTVVGGAPRRAWLPGSPRPVVEQLVA